MSTNSWKAFGKDPLEGIYWVCGEYEDYDFDVDDYGTTVGKPSGESVEFVSLVHISFDPDIDGGQDLVVTPINEYETGDFRAEYVITHYMPFEKPSHFSAFDGVTA